MGMDNRSIYKLFMLQDNQCFEYQGLIYRVIQHRGQTSTIFNPATGKQETLNDSVLVRPVVGYTLVAVEILPVSMHRPTT